MNAILTILAIGSFCAAVTFGCLYSKGYSKKKEPKKETCTGQANFIQHAEQCRSCKWSECQELPYRACRQCGHSDNGSKICPCFKFATNSEKCEYYEEERK